MTHTTVADSPAVVRTPDHEQCPPRDQPWTASDLALLGVLLRATGVE